MAGMPKRRARREAAARAAAEEATQGFSWDNAASYYKASQDWDLVSIALGFESKEELEREYKNWQQRPATLDLWGKQLIAIAKIERLQKLSEQANCGGRTSAALLAKERQTSDFNADDFIPTCCKAPYIFKGGFSVIEAESLLGKLTCPAGMCPEECRRKCMLADKVMIREQQSFSAKAGSTSMGKYLGENILHQGTGGNESFAPVAFNFVEAKDEE